MNHTKGEWQQVWNENNFPSTCIIKAIAKDGSKQSICSIHTNEQDNSNAKLIAAAPILLEALIRLKNQIEFWIYDGYIEDECLKVLKKTGTFKAIEKATQ